MTATKKANRFTDGEPVFIAESSEALYGETLNPETKEWEPHDEHGEKREQWVQLKGEPATVASSPYYSEEKKDLVFPVRLSDEAGGAVVGVPSRRLRRNTPGRRVAYFAGLGAAYDRIFSK